MAKYKLTSFIKESHPSNDQWLEAFKDALGFETLISPSYLMDKYGHLRPEEAAQLFMNDSTATQMAKDKEKFSKETGLEEDVNPYKISNRLFDHTARTANIGSTGEELHFNIIEITPETFTIEYRITSNSPNRPIGASRNYRSEPKEGVTEIKKDFNDPRSIQVRGTNFTVRSGEFMDQVYGDAASVAEGEFKFRPSETDAPGMQAGPDGYLKELTDGGIMGKIKDFVGSKGFQFGVRRPSEEEDKVAADHFLDYENKKVNSIGVDKVTGNIYASNDDYEVVLSPNGKVLKSDTSITGKYNKDALDAYQGELEKDADKYYKRQDIKNKLKSLVGYKPDEFGDYRFEDKEKKEETINESIDYIHMMKVRAGIIK